MLCKYGLTGVYQILTSSERGRKFIASIQYGHSKKQSHKWINNGTATSLIEMVKNERTVITFLQNMNKQ